MVLRIYVEKETDLAVDVYNFAGDIRVKHLAQGSVQAGWMVLTWDGRNDAGDEVASDLYFVRMKTDNKVVLKKIAVLVGTKE